MDDLLSEFLTETSESIATLDVELVHLEQNPNDRDILSNIFRLVHTIKGTCGFLGLPRLESLAHAGENVLGKFRDGELEVTPDAVTVILHTIDRIKDILGHLEQTESEPEGTDQDLKDQLNALAEGRGGGAAAAPPPPSEPEPAAEEPAAPETKPAGSGPVLDDNGFPVAAELLAEVEEAIGQGKRAASERELAAEMAAEAEREKAAEAAKATIPGDEARKAEEAAAAKAGKPSAPKKAEPKSQVPAQTAQPEGGDGARKESVAAQSIRVSVDLLEKLMTLVSELVLTRNQLLQMVRGSDDSEFAAPLQRLSHITSDLQEGVMKTRMQPIGNAWAKLPRIVRDLAQEMGKKIDLQMYGADTELDRQVLELIKDPLTHMVRNSGDHGLENSDERLAVGKPEVGVIKLNAYHEGGHIIIEISDDGRGLNIQKIKDKALANGLASEAELEGMGDQQIAQFIFKAGLSTAEKVTSVSGRGVGMDVVRTNIEQIGGTVELKTWPGKGSTFIIKIPLTLAIVSGLIVESADERFAIPQISVLELVRVTDKSETRIERINKAPVLRLRNRLLPLVSLAVLLRLDEARDSLEDEVKGQEETFIVVTQVGTYSFGIIVDRVFDTEEIVVKPVAPILRHISMFSGNTILGDGSVIMILDPNGIAGATGESTMGTGTAAETLAARESRSSEDTTSLLIFRAGSHERKAVPLGLVARLEEIELEKVEYSYGKPLVQYRGELMPLIGVDGMMGMKTEGRQPVLVFSDRERSMGLMVDEIVDIVEEHLKVELKAEQMGVIGTAVLDGKSTDIIDTGYYLTQAFGDWFGSLDDNEAGRSTGGNTVLLVDDSAFFRNLLTPLLSAAGFSVTAVGSPADALNLRERGAMFDAIISDIEMPEMDGFAFAAAVRQTPDWVETPLVALSSHASEKDLERGREAGFDDYVAKFDRDALLISLQQLISERAGRESEEA